MKHQTLSDASVEAGAGIRPVIQELHDIADAMGVLGLDSLRDKLKHYISCVNEAEVALRTAATLEYHCYHAGLRDPHDIESVVRFFNCVEASRADCDVFPQPEMLHWFIEGANATHQHPVTLKAWNLYNQQAH